MKNLLPVLILPLTCLLLRAADPPKVSDTVRADIAAMQERIAIPGGTGAHYASPKALAAAQRVFGLIPFPGMTRQQVIDLLGKPSEDLAPSPKFDKSRLIYRFDSGDGGWEYILVLDPQTFVIKLVTNSYE